MHPALMKKILALSEDPRNDFYVKMGCIAAHVNVALDDFYADEDMIKIGEICLDRLRKRRGIEGNVIENVSGEIMKHH